MFVRTPTRENRCTAPSCYLSIRGKPDKRVYHERNTEKTAKITDRKFLINCFPHLGYFFFFLKDGLIISGDDVYVFMLDVLLQRNSIWNYFGFFKIIFSF